MNPGPWSSSVTCFGVQVTGSLVLSEISVHQVLSRLLERCGVKGKEKKLEFYLYLYFLKHFYFTLTDILLVSCFIL